MNFRVFSIIAIFSFSYLSLFSQSIEDLSNKFWRLKSANIAGQEYDFTSDINNAPTLQFSGGNIRGNGGCNAYHTNYTLGNGSLEFGSIKSTKMACSNLRLNEQFYFQTLTQLHQTIYYPERNELILNCASGDRLVFYSQFTKNENFLPPPPPKKNKIQKESSTKERKSKIGKKSSRKVEPKDKKGKKDKKDTAKEKSKTSKSKKDKTSSKSKTPAKKKKK